MIMTSAPMTTIAQNGTVAEDNPAARPKGRHFSADYELAISEVYERITEDGGKGALLRREGACTRVTSSDGSGPATSVPSREWL
jgi:hypothetical protein